MILTTIKYPGHISTQKQKGKKCKLQIIRNDLES